MDSASETEQVLAQLDKVLRSAVFQGAERSSRLLRYLVEQTVAGKGDQIKDYTIATEVLGRGTKFDPRVDAIARVEASRLRSRLEQYYSTAGRQDEFRLVLPRGSYATLFEKQSVEREAKPTLENRKVYWFAAGSFAGAVVVLLAISLFRQNPAVVLAPARQPLTIQADLGPDARFANTVGTQLALSPDGSRLVTISVASTGGSQLRLSRFDGSPSVAIPGTEGGRNPFFSPDGQWIAFWAGGKVKKVSLAGGAPMVLADAPDLLGGSWGDDGNIIATLTVESKLWQLSSNGGTARPVLDLSPNLIRLLWPQVLKGSKACIYSNAALTPDSGSIEALDFRTGKRKVLVKNGTYGRVLPSGHLVYVNQGTLYALVFDAGALEVRGAPAALVQNISYSSTFGFAQYDVSESGTLVYRPSATEPQVSLQRLNRNGGAASLLSSPGPFLWPRVSADGNNVVFTRLESGESTIWVAARDSQTPNRITPSPGIFSAPVWTPDGRHLIMQGRDGLNWVPYPVNGGSPKPFLRGMPIVPWSFTPDGSRLAYCQMNPQTHFDLWTIPIHFEKSELRAGIPEPFLQTKAVETYPSFSPDGSWIAYVALKESAYQVYVRPFPAGQPEVQISRNGGRLPFWARKTRELVYETEDHRLMAASWSVSGGEFKAGSPQPWSSVELADTGVLANFDLAGDGSVIGLLPSKPQRASQYVTFRLNFFEELQGRLPAGPVRAFSGQ